MKNIIFKFSLTAITCLCSGLVMAQQQAADTKPKIADSKTVQTNDQSSLPPAGPQLVPEVKAMSLAEQPKPIVPGGEFIPRDTRDLKIPDAVVADAYKPVEVKLPEMKVLPVPEPVKKNGTAPAAHQPEKLLQQTVPQQQ